jgi:hypothetical protein
MKSPIKIYQDNYRKELRKELSKKTNEELCFLIEEMKYKPFDKRASNITCIVNNAMACVPIGTMTFESMLVKQKLASYYGSDAILKRKIKQNPEFFSNILFNK